MQNILYINKFMYKQYRFAYFNHIKYNLHFYRVYNILIHQPHTLIISSLLITGVRQCSLQISKGSIWTLIP